jgi:hypothetical protein
VRVTFGNRDFARYIGLSECRIITYCYPAFTMSAETIVGLIIGAIAGVLGNLLVGYLFYQRSGAELRTEAERLRQESGHVRTLLNTLAHALEAGGQIEGVWNEDGELQSFVVRKDAALQATASLQSKGYSTTPRAAQRAHRRSRRETTST